MITLEELIQNWFEYKTKFTQQQLISLFQKLICDRKSRCYFVTNMPYDIFNKKQNLSWKDYIDEIDNQSYLLFYKPLVFARRKARLSLDDLKQITGISTYYLDDIEFGQDERRFLEIIAFLKGCGCSLEFGVTKDLIHTRYNPANTLEELGIFFRKIRNRHHWSFQKLSEESGYSVPMLKRLEHGNLNPTVVMMRKIIKSYNLELMTRTPKN